jgi:hypothetical protein
MLGISPGRYQMPRDQISKRWISPGAIAPPDSSEDQRKSRIVDAAWNESTTYFKKEFVPRRRLYELGHQGCTIEGGSRIVPLIVNGFFLFLIEIRF